jgi:hypothetical protein
MSYKHTVNMSVNSAVESLGGTPKEYTASGLKTLKETINNAVTDLQITFNLDVSAVKSFVALSDRDITLETNNAGAPVNTILLKAGVPYIWTIDSYDTFKLTSDVTALFITNASGAAAVLTISALEDVTP